MSGLMIRLNEAELLRAGMPRDAVVALRDIVKIIGAGISVGDISGLEGLVITAGRSTSADVNDHNELQRLSDQITMIRRDVSGHLSTLRSEIDAIRHASPVNLTDIINRIATLEHQVAGL